MTLKHRQAGWTFLGVLAFLLVAGVVVSIGFKLAPAYADWHTLKQVMETTTRDRALMSKNAREIRSSLAKRMGINNLNNLPKEFVTITKDKGDVFLDVDYEVRTPLFGNVDAVMTFKERFAGQELE